jgi:GT2 family glycosyltransferase
MVSVICCARNDGDGEKMIESIRDNCCYSDMPFQQPELIEEVGWSSMGAGYNNGVKRASGDVLVFTHTDVTMWAGSMLWDEMIKKVQLPDTGFVGVAGTTRLDESAVWWQGYGTKRGAVAHRSNKQTYVSSFGPFGEVEVLDGVFLACRKDLFNDPWPWPEDTGFHFYDIEMTLKASQLGFKNYVVPLPILHGSHGETKESWYQARSKFLERHGYFLRAR